MTDSGNAQTYEEFMDDLMASDPERYALVAYRYPVLSNRQMKTRTEESEIPISQLNGRTKTLAMTRLNETAAYLFDAAEAEEVE